MDKGDTVYEYWHIIFKPSQVKHWIMRWLSPEFQHCYAVKESAGGQFWIIVDSKNCYTDIRLESKLDYPHIRLLEPNSVILSIKAIMHPDRNRHTLCIFNCVEVCKSVIGVRAFWCWTPYQLNKRLTQ